MVGRGVQIPTLQILAVGLWADFTHLLSCWADLSHSLTAARLEKRATLWPLSPTLIGDCYDISRWYCLVERYRCMIQTGDNVTVEARMASHSNFICKRKVSLDSLGSSGRAGSTLNGWAISPSLKWSLCLPLPGTEPKPHACCSHALPLSCPRLYQEHTSAYCH